MSNAATPVDVLRPRDFNPEGLDQKPYLIASGDVLALPLPKLAAVGYNAVSRVPTDATVGTGLTFRIDLVDDGTDARDLGKVVRVGVTVKKLVGGSDTGDIDTAAATEATVDVTLDATSGEAVIGTLAIANAALDSVGAGDQFFVRVRRVATHANDTCPGRALLLGVIVDNTFTA